MPKVYIFLKIVQKYLKIMLNTVITCIKLHNLQKYNNINLQFICLKQFSLEFQNFFSQNAPNDALNPEVIVAFVRKVR